MFYLLFYIYTYIYQIFFKWHNITAQFSTNRADKFNYSKCYFLSIACVIHCHSSPFILIVNTLTVSLNDSGLVFKMETFISTENILISL